MAYNPEFWQQPTSERHRVMPAFGALATAAYYEFIDSGKPQAAIRTATEEFTRPPFNKAEISDRLIIVSSAVSNAVTDEDHDEFMDSMTLEQQEWMGENLFWPRQNGVRRLFYRELMGAGSNAVIYFAIDTLVHSGLDTMSESYVWDPNRVMSFFAGPAFLKGLKQASSAKQLYWNIPDNESSVSTNKISIGKARSVFTNEVLSRSLPFISNEGLQPPLVGSVKLERTSANKAYQGSYAWDMLPSSGCPVRHERLGGVMIKHAFTDEQIERVSKVADFTESGGLKYNWDPFLAAQHLALIGLDSPNY